MTVPPAHAGAASGRVYKRHESGQRELRFWGDCGDQDSSIAKYRSIKCASMLNSGFQVTSRIEARRGLDGATETVRNTISDIRGIMNQ